VLMVEARLGFQDSNWRSKNFSWLQFYLFIWVAFPGFHFQELQIS